MADAPRGRPGGRVRRFVALYGWRAYALPLLVVATLVTLVDLARPTAAQVTAVTAGTVLPADVVGPANVATASEMVDGDAAPAASGGYVRTGSGTLTVVPGASRVYGAGPLRRFVVEVEDGTGADGAAFAQAVEQILADPRSWGAGGRMSFQRVGAAEAAAGSYDFRVSLVSPGSMETYCPGVGTRGYTSCRFGERAVINMARWETAVPDYDGDIATYRQYVVNHEVGHALGHGHEQCGGPGQLAPVMQQQTLGLDGCRKNPWPYPSSSSG